MYAGGGPSETSDPDVVAGFRNQGAAHQYQMYLML
jgi:hypothetical protein